MNREKFLNQLQKTENFCSLGDIAARCGIQLPEVAEQIRSLKREGYEFELQNGTKIRLKRGYLSRSEIADFLKSNRQIFVVPSVDSTNIWAAENSGKAEHGSVFLAEYQTSGRGRRGKSWESSFGTGLFFSVLEYPKLPPWKIPQLTLCAAMAVCFGIYDVTGMLPQIKWPNDIVMEGRKLCGILAELKAVSEHVEHLVIGIGLNVNQDEFSEEISHVATSLKQLTGKEWNRNHLVASICNRMETYESNLLKNCFPMETYRKLCVTLGKKVTVITAEQEFVAEAVTVTEEGGLTVRFPDGSEKTVTSGEVSVRGMLGYV